MSARFLVIVVLAACAPSDSLGETLWTRPALESDAMVGRGGQLVLGGSSLLRIVAQDGAFLWEVLCTCSYFQIDDEGNVYVLDGQGDTRTVERRAAADGTIEWSKTLSLPAAYGHVLALDARGSIWWFVQPMQPVDFGGGALGTPVGGSVFGQFQTTDGSYVASGTLDFAFRGAHQLPDGGFVVTTSLTGELVAFDAAGVTRWHSIADVTNLVTDEDGALTVLQFVARNVNESSYDVVRLDPAGNERWRRRGFGSGESIVALPSGRALVAGSDSLAGGLSFDAGFLALYDAQGDIRRENFEAEAVVLIRGAATDSYRFFRRSQPGGAEGQIEARSAP